MRSALAADLDREQSLTAMWHALRASNFAGRNRVEIDAGVVHALLNARYYESTRGQFISQDPTFLAIGNPALLAQFAQQDQNKFLMDPQLANSYNYGRDNPISLKDPLGLAARIFADNPVVTGLEYYGYYDLGRQYIKSGYYFNRYGRGLGSLTLGVMMLFAFFMTLSAPEIPRGGACRLNSDCSSLNCKGVGAWYCDRDGFPIRGSDDICTCALTCM